MFQVYVDDLRDILAALTRTGRPIYAGPREVWRRWGDREGGKCEIVVQDPDGYLVMLAQDLGERPLASEA